MNYPPRTVYGHNLWSQIMIMTLRQVILEATTTARRSQHKSFLEKVPILEQLTEYEILTIADALGEHTYEDGAVVCMQGEVGDAFYIIKKVISRSRSFVNSRKDDKEDNFSQIIFHRPYKPDRYTPPALAGLKKSSMLMYLLRYFDSGKI